jgi:hypothetical protein
MAPSHHDRAVLGAGTVANDAEHSKRQKYSSLSATYHFVPIAVETIGHARNEASAFFLEVGRRIDRAE